MKVLRSLTLGAAAFALAACTPTAVGNTDQASTTTVENGLYGDDGVDEAETTTEEPVTLHRGDFTLKVRKTSEECFGDGYGCSVGFKVVPEYNGDESDLDSITADVTYTVSGMKGGPQTETISFDGGNYDPTDGEGFGDTSSRGAKLTAKVIRVESY